MRPIADYDSDKGGVFYLQSDDEEDAFKNERFRRSVDIYRLKVWNLINKLHGTPAGYQFEKQIDAIIDSDHEIFS